jgi:molecular chaperone DnaJ
MDFYSVLGLGHGASAAEIKRAYRRLARRYHPGINPGDRSAEAMFQRITEAYETLIDPTRRQQYDQHGAAPAGSATESLEFAGFDFTVAAHGAQAATFTELFADILHPAEVTPSGRPEPGADLHATLTVSFVDAMRGVERHVVVTRQDACFACRGAGQVTQAERRCTHCHGAGQVRWARGHMVFSKACAACEGSGRQRRQRCGVCAGQGRVVRSDAIAVPVPPGTADGTRIRVVGQGHAGRNHGTTGDLYVTIHVVAHPLVRRVGDDLVMQVPVAVHEAVLGARIEVPSLDGPLRVRIPPGTQAGQQFRLPERGVPTHSGGRGDLIVEVQLVLPAAIDQRSKELMREFGERNPDDVRSALRL